MYKLRLTIIYVFCFFLSSLCVNAGQLDSLLLNISKNSVDIESINKELSLIDSLIEHSSKEKKPDKVLEIFDYYYRNQLFASANVLVHLYDKYFVTKQINFPSVIQAIQAQVYVDFNRHTLVGEKLPQIILKDINGEDFTIPLNNNRYSLYFFYSPDCSTCVEQSMQMQDILYEYMPDIDIYNIYTGVNKQQWEDYLKDNFDYAWRGVRVFNLWQPDKESDLKKLYGLIKKPVLIFVDNYGKILARQLSPNNLRLMLDKYLPNYFYGSDESQVLLEKCFKHNVNSFESDILQSISRQYKNKSFDISYKHLMGDCLYYLNKKNTESSRLALSYLVDSLILNRSYLWNSELDSLQVLSLASFIHDRNNALPLNSRLPKMFLNVVQKNTTAVKSVDIDLSNIKEGYIIFYSKSCSTCAEELKVIDNLLLNNELYKDKSFYFVELDCINEHKPKLFEELLNNFDISQLPFIIYVDSDSVLRRKYVHFNANQ